MQIEKQINLQKAHNARTKRALKNLENNKKLRAKFSGIYTLEEINNAD